MVTDVLLLNTFNSLGLPTSTTVSIVFELLGGTIAVACWKIWANGYPLTDLGLYVNSGKALAMIMGILASVVIAFLRGLSCSTSFDCCLLSATRKFTGGWAARWAALHLPPFSTSWW